MFLFGSVRIRIRIELKCWIQIQVNPDPQPCLKVKYLGDFESIYDPDPVKMLRICYPSGQYQWHHPPLVSGVIDTAHHQSAVSLTPPTSGQWCH
jgi:hypothetical protein